MTAPTRQEIKAQLEALLRGDRSRSEVSAWAGQWLNADPSPRIEDNVVWTALARLGGVDLRTGDRDYLYVESDFHVWLDEVEASTDSSGGATT